MSTVKANNYYDTTGGSNAQLYGVASPPNSMGFRNRIINGGMVFNQRNAGASVTANDGIYTLDRWYYNAWQNGKGTIQRSTTAPAGFINSLLFTSSSAYTVGAGETFDIQQRIEGLNVADLAWGSASAATVTLSFWVRSSLTGTFGGALQNSAQNRSYVFSYTINAANTWEQKSITIAGDTSGTWLTTNGIGILLTINLGAGANYQNAAGSWVASAKYTVTGQTSIVGTNGATFYITGVQLEAGTVASPFERRDYGRELIMCQRYYQVDTGGDFFTVSAASAYDGAAPVRFPVTMRAAPTITLSGTKSGSTGTTSASAATVYGYSMNIQSTSGTGPRGYSAFTGTYAAEL